MNFVILDEDEVSLCDTEKILKTAIPNSNIITFQNAHQALTYILHHSIDVVFLDIEMPEMNGIILAKKLKKVRPNVHIIFVSGHEKYAVDAFAIHVAGFLMKPILIEDVLREITFLYGDSVLSKPNRVCVYTFGGFDIFVDGEILNFKRAKSKELFAYLIDRNGRGITAREACAILWEDSVYSKKQQSYYRNVVAEFVATLVKSNIQEILIKKRNYLAIRPELIDCDSYQFINKDRDEVSMYHDDYMPCYSWAIYSSWKF